MPSPKKFLFLGIFIFLAIPPIYAWSVPRPPAQQIHDAAARWSLDPRLIEAIVHVESRNRSTATSRKGAMGLMQVMPRTADEIEIHDPYHPLDNLMGACRYLRELMNRYRRDLPLVLAAYNAGPKNVDRYRGIPPFPETRKYVREVLAKYDQLKLVRPTFVK